MFKPYKAYIVAGPNGAGKTTFARQKLAELAIMGVSNSIAFLNADEIERQLSSITTPGRNLQLHAGRELLRQLGENVARRNDFMLETTLSSVAYARRIPEWSNLGYRIELYYLRLESIEVSIERVRRRVVAGGHGIPERDLRRRFGRSAANFESIYKQVVDKWVLYDSLEGELRFADAGGRLP